MTEPVTPNIDATEVEALETREWLESLDYVLRHSSPEQPFLTALQGWGW